MAENEVYRVPLGEAFQVFSVASHGYTANLLSDYCYGSSEYQCDSSASRKKLGLGTTLLITRLCGAAAVHGGYLASVILRTISKHFQGTLQNIEFKKLLPPQGVDWLFVRARAKQIKDGRMDVEVTILDEESELVALSNHVLHRESYTRADS